MKGGGSHQASKEKDPSFIYLGKRKKSIYCKPNICNVRPAYKE